MQGLYCLGHILTRSYRLHVLGKEWGMEKQFGKKWESDQHFEWYRKLLCKDESESNEEITQEEDDKSNGKHVGSTVQIKIPVVATVIQQSEQGGHMSMAVVSPGPNGELVNQSGLSNFQNDSFVYSSTLTGNDSLTGSVDDIDEMQLSNAMPPGLMSDVEIEFLDEQGRRVGEDEFQENLKLATDICQPEDIKIYLKTVPT
ncbi:hypothetical protein NQ318_016149 [Aromia moschata]|uniref:Uncharacterized protein n=1 Tax=Aromia moschata TaxID=1265417 RepID=A0AAV8Y100_9CUCU|nr:hypothetical protein NQ318_016149 [Aromia moschata]